MTISEMIKRLQAIKETEGDIRVTVYDDYTADEGYDYNNEDLWVDASAVIDVVTDDDDNELEKVVLIK